MAGPTRTNDANQKAVDQFEGGRTSRREFAVSGFLGLLGLSFSSSLRNSYAQEPAPPGTKVPPAPLAQEMHVVTVWEPERVYDINGNAIPFETRIRDKFKMTQGDALAALICALKDLCAANKRELPADFTLKIGKVINGRVSNCQKTVPVSAVPNFVSRETMARFRTDHPGRLILEFISDDYLAVERIRTESGALALRTYKGDIPQDLLKNPDTAIPENRRRNYFFIKVVPPTDKRLQGRSR